MGHPRTNPCIERTKKLILLNGYIKINFYTDVWRSVLITIAIAWLDVDVVTMPGIVFPSTSTRSETLITRCERCLVLRESDIPVCINVFFFYRFEAP